METSNTPATTGNANSKKRQQIQQANKVVFIWVALAAGVVAIAIVLSQFMLKQFMYNNKVYAAQAKTNDILIANANAYEPLKTEIAKLVSNQQLTRLKVDPADNALQVIIDAMPTEDDRIGLAASLQQIILARSGAKIDTISFADASIDGTSTVSTPATTASEPGANPINFTFVATGSYDAIKALLRDIHASIRPVTIMSIKLSGTSALMKAEVTAATYYATPQTTDMTKEKIKP